MTTFPNWAALYHAMHDLRTAVQAVPGPPTRNGRDVMFSTSTHGSSISILGTSLSTFPSRDCPLYSCFCGGQENI
ncbi:hypothetical protein M378DRAFT_157885 [Amanita muscaria Koide BX008]|uniref:Uncharacterized protein n=1 Tax=Amanita muscaria (strain Koide BX008) TaxID=946122 RepID=A0A0C2TNJ3_AMAMK|nr:hypothetical protein M378DRAFT_157885 [Amanita muscaria Koide BX008]